MLGLGIILIIVGACGLTYTLVLRIKQAIRYKREEDVWQRQREAMNDEMWQRINDTLRRQAEEDKAK